ncbi:MAG: leucine-rich repeat domain-containing protein, partial [Flavobacteriales bacterium]|nr:leucine-rich repeat domain-containing protein [Flavobacteriales bacterium]
PASVTVIEDYAFDECEKLENVTFEAGSQLKTIDEGAFRYTDIASIEIPASVTEIGGEAFKYCSSLVAVHCRPATPPELGENVFNTNATGRKIYVPNSSVKKYKEAANWSTYKDHIIGE